MGYKKCNFGKMEYKGYFREKSDIEKRKKIIEDKKKRKKEEKRRKKTKGKIS